MRGKMTGVRCMFCKDVIYSRHRHDWRTCKCGGTFVDGGMDYLRYGTTDNTTPQPQVVEDDDEAL